MKHFFLFSLFALLAVNIINAQQRNCASMEVLEQLMQENPGMQQQMEAIEQHTNNFLSNSFLESRDVVTIPVVVHVVYRTTTENISDAQILSQIAVLNNDFRKLNADVANTPPLFAGLAADSEIQFCMAQRDPNGNATTGITRKYYNRTSWGTSNAVKNPSQGGVAPWDATKYLNIWVCNIGGGVLGYAQFPGGPASTDGIVVDYRYFGTTGTATSPYHLGRTATHEVGHWLNLRHIWGDATCGNDFVSDTPVHNASNGGCPSYPHYSTCTGTPVEMTMNYMDYTYDACMYMFTFGQKNRMQAVFAPGGPRFSITTSNGCVPPDAVACGTPAGLAASNITTGSATISWTAVSGATSYILQYRPTGATTWSTVSTASTTYNLTGLAASTTYQYQVQANCNETLGAFSAIANFTTSTPAPSCGTPSGLFTTNITSTSATLNWSAVSGATSYNIQYRPTGTSTWTTVSTAATTYNLTGLASSTTYEFQVQANCNGTLSAYSTNSAFTTSTDSSGCGIPTGLSATGITQNSATLSWAFVNGASSYNLQYRLVGSANWTTINVFVNTYLLTGLTASSNYEFRVQTLCKNSTSSYSTIATFSTLGGGASCGTPGSLSATNVTTNSATLNWAAVAGATSYNVQYRLFGTATWTTMTSAANSYNATGLSPASTYEYQVQANCNGTLSAYSAIASFTTNNPAPSCGTPGGLNTTNITSNSATLNWSAVAGATSYNVQYRPAGTSTWTTMTSPVNSYNATGLTASTNYEFQVQANCNGTLGAYSAVATFTTSAGGGGTCNDIYEPNEIQFAATGIQVNQTISAAISSTGDNDWFRFNNTSAQPYIKVDLTSLPANYDIRLYQSLSLVGESTNPGTANESITYNVGTVRSYYIHVFGNGGAADPNDCYDLTATISGSPLREDGGLDNIQTDEIPSFVMFPNPAATEVMIDILSASETPTEIVIFDINGQLVKRLTQQFTAEATMTRIAIDDLVSGVYMVQVKNGERNAGRRLVISR